MTFDPLAGDPLRPDNWDEFIGQEALKDRLIKNIDAAVADGNRPPAHTLLFAGPGTGKTTLARLIARRLDVPLQVFTCPVDFQVIQRLLVEGFTGVLFLDEIHRLSKREQEDYLTLLHDGYMEFRGEKYQVGWLMVIGATTDRKEIIATLRDRFPYKPEFDPYTDEEIAQIVQSMALRTGFDMDDKVAVTLARACGGTPRRARDFVFAARDLRILNGGEPTAEEILDHLRIDPDGLGVEHWKYLTALKKLGTKAGLAPIAAYLNEDPKVVVQTERALIEQGLIRLTGSGREMRTEAFERMRARNESMHKEMDDKE